MDKRIFNVASYKRGDTLIKTIESIYDQADIINIALNDYDDIPVELYDKKINIFLTNNEKGDAYKFTNLPNSNGYFFTIDDDLIYPNDYAEYMISKIEEYNRKSIITIHGRNFGSFPISSFYGHRPVDVHHFKYKLENDIKIQFGGTGVMAFHTDLFKVGLDYFEYPNMADVWIGKYAKENDINIICVKHEYEFVKQQEFDESIYTNDLKNDKLQTMLVNEVYDQKELSIIIPTFNIPNYLIECLESIITSIGNFNCEILVGIDNCENTLNVIKNQKFDERINFYYFDENVGPYIIKNSLSKITKSDYILFFDSDDIMLEQLIIDVLDRKKDCDIIKPMYLDFNDDVKNVNELLTYTNTFGEGVFGVKKRLFLYFNGFEGWRCAADSDFMNRLHKNNVNISKTNNIGFYRRVHPTSLTQDNSTSYSSILRSEYSKISNAKTYFGPLSELSVKPFTKVNVGGIYSPNIVVDNQKIGNKTNSQKLDLLKEIPYIKSKTQEGGNINNDNIIITKTISRTNSKLFNKKRR